MTCTVYFCTHPCHFAFFFPFATRLSIAYVSTATFHFTLMYLASRLVKFPPLIARGESEMLEPPRTAAMLNDVLWFGNKIATHVSSAVHVTWLGHLRSRILTNQNAESKPINELIDRQLPDHPRGVLAQNCDTPIPRYNVGCAAAHVCHIQHSAFCCCCCCFVCLVDFGLVSFFLLFFLFCGDRMRGFRSGDDAVVAK